MYNRISDSSIAYPASVSEADELGHRTEDSRGGSLNERR